MTAARDEPRSEPYAKLLRSIWANKDFTSLHVAAQRLFMLLISQPDVSRAGVLPLTERRWARLASDTDADSVRKALDTLDAAQFIIVDYDTEELAVRTYIQHDGMHLVPNGRKSIDKACAEVLSSAIRTHLETVLARVDGTVKETVEPPQQQATAPFNGSSSPVGSVEDTQGQGSNDAAAAAYELLIKHKIRTEDIRSPPRYTRKLRIDLPIEHGEAVHGYMLEHPDATPAHLLRDVFNLNIIDLHNLGVAS